MTKDEAFEMMNADDHAVWSPEQAQELADALGFPKRKIPVRIEKDRRSEFKGLMLWGINPKTGVEFVEGDTTEIVDPLSMLPRMCLYFNLRPANFIGRGYQHREYVRQLHDHFYPKVEAVNE